MAYGPLGSDAQTADLLQRMRYPAPWAPRLRGLTMAIGLVGRKCGMTRVFTDAGVTVPVTVVEALPNRISQVKSDKADGYRAVQITIGARRPSRVSKALAGHFAKANVAAGNISHEFRLNKGEGEALAAGGELKVDMFTAGQIVDVTGTTVGKGFAGTMKRHNFAGGMKTHGNPVRGATPSCREFSCRPQSYGASWCPRSPCPR